MIYPWGNSRRFNTYSNYFKDTFGERVQKVSIDAGFTCPNRDGKVAYGGCTYCNNESFNPSYCTPDKTVTQQIEEGIAFHKKRYRRTKKYLAYFQANSNTYAPLERLKILYEEALRVPDIIGLVIGTRPDCINEELLQYLKTLSEKFYIIIEYGIESCYNPTLERINRGHSFEQSVEALKLTSRMGLKTGAHFIFGLPGETKEMMLKEAKIISKLPLTTVKFHQLQIIKGTKMAKEYQVNPDQFEIFEMDEYIDFFIRFIERFNPNIVIERFVSESPPRVHAGPTWGMKRVDQIINIFEESMKEIDTWQGKYYKQQ